MGEIISLREQKTVIAGVEVGGAAGRRIRRLELMPGVDARGAGRAARQAPAGLRRTAFIPLLRNRETVFVRASAS
ncbi:MAG: iron transporter FeoA [Desulfovibrio sp.]|jgi:hypothetical protein|nr:iron transporter FeoA [Desulfovibrio sp.]